MRGACAGVGHYDTQGCTSCRPGIINIRKYGQFGANCFEFDWYGSTIKRQAKGTDRGMYTQQSGNSVR